MNRKLFYSLEHMSSATRSTLTAVAMSVMVMLALFFVQPATIQAEPLAVCTWNGSESTNWADRGNWSCGGRSAAPSLSDSVSIPATTNDPVISDVVGTSPDVQVASLSVAAGASLTVGANASLLVVGDFDISAGSNLKVDIKPGGSITVQEYYTIRRYRNHNRRRCLSHPEHDLERGNA